MDRNFKVRVLVGVGMFVVSLLGIYAFDAVPFKIMYAIFSLVAMIELFSFLKHGATAPRVALVILEAVFLICGAIFVARTDQQYFWYIILGVPGYDVFAYFFGKSIGGKIFKKSRPFPKISKNKTWEGTIFGLLISILMVVALMATRGDFKTDWMYLLCSPLALLGDLFESYVKRKFKVKDSNEIVIHDKWLGRVEILVGGSEGHGGFLDRSDSAAFTMTVLLIISYFTTSLR